MGRLGNQGDLSLPKVQKRSVGRPVADSIPRSVIQQSPNLFPPLRRGPALRCCYLHPVITGDWGERGMDPFSKGLRGIGTRSRDAIERGLMASYNGRDPAARVQSDNQCICKFKLD